MNGGKPDLSSGQHSNSPLSSQANSGESKAASVTSTETGARSKLPVLTVTIRHSSGSYNRYEWDETRQQLCLAERVRFDRHNFFETGTVPGTLTPRGVELTVLLPADLPVFPGALVKARPIGLLKLNSQSQLTQARRDILHQEFIIAVPLADSLYVNTRTLTDLPPSWKWEVEQGLMSQLPKVETFTDLGLSQNKANNAKGQGLNWQWEEAEEAYKVVARCRQAFRSAQTNPTRPNWQISDEELDDFLRGDLFKEDETARHTDAENQFFRLPHRFQQHVARCLLPHERIIAWIFRPAFKEGVLWRKMQHQDAILIQTDRQLLWLTDTLPPGSTLVDWGYRVEAFSLHKLRQVELVGIEARTDLSPLQGSTSVSSSLLLYEPTSSNKAGSNRLELVLRWTVGKAGAASVSTRFKFNFTPRSTSSAFAPQVGRQPSVEQELKAMAERLRQFVPDKTSHNLLRLFHFSVPQSQIEIEQTGRKESLAHSRSGQPIIGSTVKTEQSDDRTLPDILKMWLRENHYKLLMLPALTRYYSSFAPGVEPGFAALVAPDLIVFQLSKPCANAKLKQINRNETSFNPAKDEDLFFELSAETGESERMNNGLDCWSGTVLIFHTGTPNAKNRTGQPIISWLKKEKANKNSARTKLSDTTSVAVYPIKIISSVEMLYSILGCYLELTVAPDPASSFSSKRELSQAVLYPRTEQEQQEKSSFRFYFNSPEGASFRLLYLALRQLLDICL